jgi:SPP1 family predicted phage head-tail adaptor
MNAPPTIGAMRQRVTIEAPVDAPDEAGGFTRTYLAIAQAWASIEPIGAREQFAQQRLEQSTTHVVTIRWRAELRSQMRFDFKGRKLVIRTVEDNGERRRHLTCLCEEIS